MYIFSVCVNVRCLLSRGFEILMLVSNEVKDLHVCVHVCVFDCLKYDLVVMLRGV